MNTNFQIKKKSISFTIAFFTIVFGYYFISNGEPFITLYNNGLENILSIIIISILSLLTLVLGYTTFNLLRKVEKSEDIIVKYDKYITEFSKQLEASDKRLNEIDMKGMFKSDDEIGWFFEQIKVLQNGISEFKNS